METGRIEKRGAMEVIGYSRVSTDEQVSNGVSLEAQEEKIRAYCKVKDWDLLDIVRDEGISAKNLNRPGLKSILGRVSKRNGKRGFDCMVVVKLDRLTRSVGDLAYLNKVFETNKLVLVSIQESVDTSTASGRLFHNIIACLSEWERGVISERTRDALRHKRNNGCLAGEIPYGFRLKEDGETLEPIPEEQKILKKIRSLRESSLSYWKIANRLNSLRVLTKKGKRWYPATVQSVLQHSSCKPLNGGLQKDAMKESEEPKKIKNKR